MINCTHCTHYQHNADQHICDAGIFDIRIFGKADIAPMQEWCKCADVPNSITACKATESQTIDAVNKIIKQRGRPAKC